MKKKRFLLIIGNGFDLELGLKTSYKDFINSKTYEKYSESISNHPSYKKNYNIDFDTDIPIFDYLKSVLHIQKWIDLEMEIGKLASRKIKRVDNLTGKYKYVPAESTPYMMHSFDMLRKCLNEYILGLDIPHVLHNYAAELIRILAVNEYKNVDIVTFNYTPLERVTGMEIKVPVHYIHGEISEGLNPSLILGVQDDIEIDKSYSYVIKSHSPYYHSSRIIDLLEEADEIIFFGHSLGETDYPYFSEFFQSQCKRIEPDKRKKIRIFTFDEKSRLDILYQLRIMNNKQTRLFFENADFALYRTDDYIDDRKIQVYFNELINDLSLQIV
ncbi:AbiH family protein [uncultured Bacteroides sp.]|uniref:AbiH family protein n=1 Tax=uncultured Bacteroides sp. TaxID=162156 RepID=UPI002617077C|nr:AbiH family protein [uncultured Bacteroides sp.]